MARETAKTAEPASGQDGRRGRGLAQVRKMSAASHLDPALEAPRRLGTLLVTVPSLLNRHLRPVLGWHRFAFIPKVFALAGTYKKQFSRPEDDAQLRRVKATFLLVGILYNELAKMKGAERALSTTQSFLHDLGCAVQRKAYFPPDGEARTWEYFHDAHETQMREGFISTNENDGIHRSDERVTLDIVRCRFHECFRDMGNPAITLAFCRSDETVFNEYSPMMRFHRGPAPVNTIARGAARCTFIYERQSP